MADTIHIMIPAIEALLLRRTCSRSTVTSLSHWGEAHQHKAAYKAHEIVLHSLGQLVQEHEGGEAEGG